MIPKSFHRTGYTASTCRRGQNSLFGGEPWQHDLLFVLRKRDGIETVEEVAGKTCWVFASLMKRERDGERETRGRTEKVAQTTRVEKRSAKLHETKYWNRRLEVASMYSYAPSALSLVSIEPRRWCGCSWGTL